MGQAIKLSVGRRSRLRATEEDSLSTIPRLLRWEGTKSRVVVSWGHLWGWSTPIQVTLCSIDSCYSLNRGIRHLERSFHLSSTQGGLSPPLTTLGDYHPLERIITSHYPGGLSPPKENYHLSPCRFWIFTPICRDKRPAVHIWSTSSLTPFPHNNSGLVICFYLKGYWLGALTNDLQDKDRRER